MLRQAGDSDGAQSPDGAKDERHFLLGQDHAGLWVVTEASGLCGGIFSTRDAALRFAKSETADQSPDLALASDPLELVVRRPRVRPVASS